MDTKRLGVLDVAVKDVGDGASGFGEFEAVLSTDSLDRDGEVVDVRAFEPLPPSIVVHTDHVFSVENAVARAVPSYEDGRLVVRGFYASDPAAQAVRAKVREGIVTTMSAGFMSAQRSTKDGVPHITKAELLEGSFVTIPSNRDAMVLAAKAASSVVKSGDLESERRQHMTEAISTLYGDRAWLRDYDDDVIYIERWGDVSGLFRQSYTVGDSGTVDLTGTPEEVVARTTYELVSAQTDPEKAAAPAAAKSPADVALLAVARAQAEAATVL